MPPTSGSLNLAALRGEHAAHSVEIERIGHQHIERFCWNGNDVTAPQMCRRAFDRFRERMILIDLD